MGRRAYPFRAGDVGRAGIVEIAEAGRSRMPVRVIGLPRVEPRPGVPVLAVGRCSESGPCGHFVITARKFFVILSKILGGRGYRSVKVLMRDVEAAFDVSETEGWWTLTVTGSGPLYASATMKQGDARRFVPMVRPEACGEGAVTRAGAQAGR